MKFKNSILQLLSAFLLLSFLNIPPLKASTSVIDSKLNDYFETVPSAWKGHRLFAEWLVHEIQPGQVVDLGVDYGYSTFVFANALRDNGKGIVTGIDLFQGDGMTGNRDTYDQVIANTKTFALENIEIIAGNFNEVSQDWKRPIDILHIDGYHSYEAVLNDFTTWSPFVKDDGIILFHDINVPDPAFGVIHLFRELKGGHKLYFLHSSGLGIFTKNSGLAEKILVHFNNAYDFKKKPL